MKKKLLIVTQDQFGYHIDAYEHAKRLRDRFDITFYCWDYGEPQLSLDGVRVLYQSRAGNIIQRNLAFRRRLLRLIREPFDLVFLKYFVGVSIVHLAGRRKPLVCDVRTGNVRTILLRRLLFDIVTRLELLTFRHVTIISPGLARRFGVRDYHLLPLGANPVPCDEKTFESLRLLYVGTLTYRKVEESVRGFGMFYRQFQGRVDCRYTLIGSGVASEVAKIEAYIREYGLEEVVTLTGYIPHEELLPYLAEANIGISFIPVTAYFDHQPPTKTYEYLLSGMAVLATETQANQDLIDERNGVLIQDTAEAFAAGLAELYDKRAQFDANAIRAAAGRHTWARVVSDNLAPYLERLSGGARRERAKKLALKER